MTGLNLFLFVLGLVGCAAAYFWGVRPRKRVNRITRSPRWRRESQEALDIGELGPMAIPTERGEEQEEQALEPTVATKADVNDASQPDTETGAVDEPVVSDPVIVLCVTAPDDKAFGGSDIRSAAESVGMRFGAMGVFHHFGVGNMQSGESLFCLANMFEPGNFDMENLAACKTHGLVLLMRLPLQIDGAVAFELLLNTAQRLARRLGGHVLNDRRQPLTPEDVARMRSVAASASAA